MRLFPSLTTYPYLIELLITLVIREVPIPNISLHLLTVADCISDEVNVSLIKIANESKIFHLAITPEGTRKANPNWKKGFYHIAIGANIPIMLIGIDYSKKCITATKMFYPTGDINKDMNEIKLYFKDFKGKNPENFSIGKIE